MVSSLKAQIRQRFVAAVAETDAHDDRRRASLLCALVGGAEVRERAAELERFVEARCPDGARSSATCSPSPICARKRASRPCYVGSRMAGATACAESTRSCAR